MKAVNLVELKVISAIAGEWGKLAHQSHGLVPVCKQQSEGQNSVFKIGDHEKEKCWTLRFMIFKALVFVPRRTGLLDREDEGTMNL
jgi:hypothetical protein